MFKEERMVNGRLCYRTDPHGPWIPYSADELSLRIVRLKALIAKAKTLFDTV